MFTSQKPTSSPTNDAPLIGILLRNLDDDNYSHKLKEKITEIFGVPSLDKIEIKPDPQKNGTRMALLTFSNEGEAQQLLKLKDVEISRRPVELIRYNGTEGLFEINSKKELFEGNTGNVVGGSLFGRIQTEPQKGGLFGGNNHSGTLFGSHQSEPQQGGGLFGENKAGSRGENSSKSAFEFFEGPTGKSSLFSNLEKKFPETEKTRKTESRSAAQILLDGLYVSKKYADVTFEVQGENILGHKAIIVERSKYFEEILDKKLESEGGMIKITVSDASPDAFKGFLEYLYRDIIQPNQETATQLLKLAKKYDIADLKGKCEAVLASKLSIENFVIVAKIVEEFESNKLREALLEFSVKNSAILKQQEYLEEIPENILVDMIEKLANNKKK